VSKKTRAPCQILGAGICGGLVANQSLLSFLSRTRDRGGMKVKGGVKRAPLFRKIKCFIEILVHSRPGQRTHSTHTLERAVVLKYIVQKRRRGSSALQSTSLLAMVKPFHQAFGKPHYASKSHLCCKSSQLFAHADQSSRCTHSIAHENKHHQSLRTSTIDSAELQGQCQRPCAIESWTTSCCTCNHGWQRKDEDM